MPVAPALSDSPEPTEDVEFAAVSRSGMDAPEERIFDDGEGV
jgi:hypothetical protein